MPTPIPNIWQLQSQGEVDELVDALRHSEPTVRKGAAAALRALGAWQAVPALEAALAAEHDWQVHAAITAALQYLDRDVHVENMVKNKDVRGLTKMLSSKKVEDIITASNALASIGDRNGAEGLVMVFRNPLLPNPARLAAAEALLRLESAPAVVTLLGALRRDNWQVRRNAAAVLGQLQAAWATEPLIKALSDSNLTVRKTAAAALRRIGGPEAIAAAAAFEEAQRHAPTPEPEPPEAIEATESAEPGVQLQPAVSAEHKTSNAQLAGTTFVEQPALPAPEPSEPQAALPPATNTPPTIMPTAEPSAQQAQQPQVTDAATPVNQPADTAQPVETAEPAPPMTKSASIVPAAESAETTTAETQPLVAAKPDPAPEPPPAPAPTPISFADALPVPAVFRKGNTGMLPSLPATPLQTPNPDPKSAPASLDETQPNERVQSTKPDEPDEKSDSDKPANAG